MGYQYITGSAANWAVLIILLVDIPFLMRLLLVPFTTF